MDEPYGAKLRAELQSKSDYYEKCKDGKKKVFAREHRQLTDRLVKLSQEQEMSKLEFEEMSSLLSEMDSLEQEVEMAGQLGNIVKRHDCIEMCRTKIEELLRRSRLRRKSEVVNSRANLECTSAHKLAVAKQKEKRRLLRQYRPEPNTGQAGPSSLPKVPTATSLRGSAESLVPDSRPATPGSSSQADTRVPTFDETFRKRMIASSSLFTPDRALPDQFKRQALMAASTSNYRGVAAADSRAGSGHSVYRGGPPLTSSEERAVLVAIGRDTSGQFRPSALSLRRGSNLHSLSRSSVTGHPGDRRRLAMESLLNQINEYRAAQHSIHPKDLLACRYLRLTPSNVTQLERQCRDLGRDPGLHGHLTEQQIIDHFDYLESMSVLENYSNNRM